MTVRDAISSYSRGELAPAKNTFVQPGTYKDNPDTAMTDGVKHAMLKAQRETTNALKKPNTVRRHLRKHHGVHRSTSPVQDHARQHYVGVMNQGHAVTGSGELFHGTTDIGAGTSNFARYATSEAPPMVGALELAGVGRHHVRTARGAEFFRMAIGTPITEAQYLGTKQSHEDAETQRESVEQAAERKEGQERAAAKLTHQDLLRARKEARAKYPAGHPERLAAERAVRASRRTDDYRSGKSDQAHVSDKKKAAEAKKDPAFYGPKDQIPTRKASVVPTRSSISTLSEHQREVNALNVSERSRYFAMRNAGALHSTAIANIRRQQERPAPTPRVVTKLRVRRRG